MKRDVLILGTIILFTVFGCGKNEDSPVTQDSPPAVVKYDPVDINKTNHMKIYVHYMPWFETPETNDGSWGIHWTMATQNPEVINDSDEREIASHYYPLIGPYASSDIDVIEYHLLLMKYSGIDGLIFDWYGSFDILDYGLNKRNTEAVIDMLDEVGLSFAITYEDRTLPEVVSSGAVVNAIAAAQIDFTYLEENYFINDLYININGAPLVTVFGPVYIQAPSEWTDILSVLSQKPTMLTLWGENADMGSNSAGEFAWVWQDNSTLQNYYTNQIQSIGVVLGSAYPGFNDYYDEGGWGGAQNWSIDHNDGNTFDQILDLSDQASLDYLQIVTWNDFGEGTMIEPTKEFGFSYLEKLQDFSGTSYSIDELELIYKQYMLRKEQSFDSSVQEALDQSFYYLVGLKVNEAKSIVDSLYQIY